MSLWPGKDDAVVENILGPEQQEGASRVVQSKWENNSLKGKGVLFGDQEQSLQRSSAAFWPNRPDPWEHQGINPQQTHRDWSWPKTYLTSLSVTWGNALYSLRFVLLLLHRVNGISSKAGLALHMLIYVLNVRHSEVISKVGMRFFNLSLAKESELLIQRWRIQS